MVHSFEELDSQSAPRGGQSSSSTCRSRPTANVRFRAAVRRGRRGTAPWPRSCVPSDRPAADAAHRRPPICRRRAKIPAAAIAAEDADRLQRRADRKNRSSSACDGVTSSRRRVGQRDRRDPRPRAADEVVVVGGHLDSVGLGAGATDDGGGCIVTWEALRIMKKLNLRPRRPCASCSSPTKKRRTRRHGVSRSHRAELAKHVMMLESDGGVFRPLASTLPSATRRARRSGDRDALERIAADRSAGSGGADIGPSVQEGTSPLSLDVDGSTVFSDHHTPADTIDKIDPVEMASAPPPSRSWRMSSPTCHSVWPGDRAARCIIFDEKTLCGALVA